MDKQAILDALESMTIKDLVDLTKAIEEKFDIDPAQLVSAAPAAPAADGEGASASEEKSAFNVVITAIGQKIPVLKTVRKIHTDIDLTKAKAYVDTLPSVVKENVDKAEAEKIKKSLEEAGATVELQ